jgi:hypothetical protein
MHSSPRQAAGHAAKAFVNRLQKESSDADMAVGAAMMVLEDAKARVRAAGETMKAAEQALEDARIALGKCMRVMA